MLVDQRFQPLGEEQRNAGELGEEVQVNAFFQRVARHQESFLNFALVKAILYPIFLANFSSSPGPKPCVLQFLAAAAGIFASA